MGYLYSDEEIARIKNQAKTPNPNPMVKAYGIKEGEKCRDCRHLFCKEFANRYYKCAHRHDTSGPGTDHRVNWDACQKHEKIK